MIEERSQEFSFGKDPTGRTIIKYRGARFFGITPPMTDPEKRIEDMDRVGIDTEVLSLSTPNVFFAEPGDQPEVARAMNDAYADLVARHPDRFKGFASIPMDAPDEALAELHRALDDLKMNGVILTSNIRGRALTSPEYRHFFEEANRMKLCIFLHPMLPANTEEFSEYVLGPIIAFPCDTTLAVAKMCYSGMLRELPDIRWIVGHAGGAIPWLMERMDNGWRDFAECRTNTDELPSVYLKKAVLRHRHLQSAYAQDAARCCRDRPHGDGERLSALVGFDRTQRVFDRGPKHSRTREEPDLQRHRARDPQQRLIRWRFGNSSAGWGRA